jgi:hypothetical protein
MKTFPSTARSKSPAARLHLSSGSTLSMKLQGWNTLFS